MHAAGYGQGQPGMMRPSGPPGPSGPMRGPGPGQPGPSPGMRPSFSGGLPPGVTLLSTLSTLFVLTSYILQPVMSSCAPWQFSWRKKFQGFS